MNIAPRRSTFPATALAFIAWAALAAGCGAFEESSPPPSPVPGSANLLADGGFEGTAPAWVVFPPAGAHELTTEQSHSGTSSIALHLSQQVGALSATQSLNPASFPEFLSGYYRVDGWPDGEAYLQFVVKATGGAAEEVRELRFVIAGAASDPEPAPEARYVFLSRGAPASGEWVYFAYPIRQAFESRAGAVPQAWNSIDVSLEARSLAGESEGTVYFDDLFAGAQIDNPNRPKETTK
jgi:hypothetical protein